MHFSKTWAGSPERQRETVVSSSSARVLSQIRLEADRNICGTFYWPLSGVVELGNRYTGKAGPEV